MSEAAKTFDAVGFGALNCDHVLESTQIRVGQDGESRSASGESDETQQAGGSAANTISGLGKLGLDTAFIGAVGQDTDAEVLLDGMREVGTSTEWVTAKRGKSGFARILVSSAGRDINVFPNANKLLSVDDLDGATDMLTKRTRLLHLASFADDEQFELQTGLMSEIPDELLVSLSPGALYVEKGPDALRPLLKRADIAFLNQAEIIQLMTFNDTPYDAIVGSYHRPAEKFMAAYPRCKFLVITFGAGNSSTRAPEGSITQMFYKDYGAEKDRVDDDYRVTSVIYARDRGVIKVRHGEVPGEIVDTTGAGDAYAAGFLYGVLRDYDPYRSALMGRIAAERSILAFGARQGLPTEPELNEALQNIDVRPAIGTSSIAVG